MGFTNDDQQDLGLEDEDDDGATKIFGQHLSFAQMMLGTKEGKYFQGRLNVSRLVETEATVKVQGLSQEILIQNTLN